MEKKEVNVLDLLAALNTGKRLIISGTLIICLLAAGFSLLLPDIYEAHVQLLPPKEKTQGFGFADLLADLPIPSLRLGEKGTPADIFIATLKSETLRRSMIDRFSLLEVYEAKNVTETLEILSGNTIVDKTEDGTISLSVRDTDPKRAMNMASTCIVLLDSINKGLTQTSAKNRYGFITSLKKVEEKKLADVRLNLQHFQEDHNAISIENQARAIIGVAGEVQFQLMELTVMRNSLINSGLSPKHPQVKEVDRQITEWQKALIFLKNGSADKDGLQDKTGQQLEFQENLFLPLGSIPEVALEYATIETDLVVQGALIKLLLQKEAESLIESTNNTSTVQVLDKATLPEEKASPHRSLIVFMAGVIGLFGTVVYVLASVYVGALKTEWQAREEAQQES